MKDTQIEAVRKAVEIYPNDTWDTDLVTWFETLVEERDKLLAACEELLSHCEEHNRDYKHQTSGDTLNRIRAIVVNAKVEIK